MSKGLDSIPNTKKERKKKRKRDRKERKKKRGKEEREKKERKRTKRICVNCMAVFCPHPVELGKHGPKSHPQPLTIFKWILVLFTSSSALSFWYLGGYKSKSVNTSVFGTNRISIKGI
jgi:hypothetical protein